MTILTPHQIHANIHIHKKAAHCMHRRKCRETNCPKNFFDDDSSTAQRGLQKKAEG
jgi:hypothetical protein